ncbi:MAG: twin-arginine translocase TatA/TatE family subunit [Rhodospirillaceae bacterium]|nr:twin-arginine translocase TatA/TatE family subunit [Rhodospirillaceae bacterium]
MGLGAWWHWVVVLIVVLVIFGGKGKIPALMGDFAKGINAFKKGIKSESETPQDTTAAKADEKIVDRS